MNDETKVYEELVRSLNDPGVRVEYAKPYDNYRAGIIPRLLAWKFFLMGRLIYGKNPSYQKLKAIEVVARIPYQSWELASYTLLTCFHGDEERAMRLARTTAFSRLAQDNETMHVVVISHLVQRLKRGGFIRHTLIPILFSFIYFVAVYVMYLISAKWALELNYLFEAHAYDEYSKFLTQNAEVLKSRPMTSEFLLFYGREVRNEYEFFESVRNDELIHRNRSIREIEAGKRNVSLV